MLAKITERLIRMNSNYGVGDMLGVVMDEDWKGGTVHRKRTSCQVETRRFRFALGKNTLFFCGRQSCINLPFVVR